MAGMLRITSLNRHAAKALLPAVCVCGCASVLVMERWKRGCIYNGPRACCTCMHACSSMPCGALRGADTPRCAAHRGCRSDEAPRKRAGACRQQAAGAAPALHQTAGHAHGQKEQRSADSVASRRRAWRGVRGGGTLGGPSLPSPHPREKGPSQPDPPRARLPLVVGAQALDGQARHAPRPLVRVLVRELLGRVHDAGAAGRVHLHRQHAGATRRSCQAMAWHAMPCRAMPCHDGS